MRKGILLMALLLAGCSSKWDVSPMETVDLHDNELRRGVSGDSPDVRPISKADRIDRGYQDEYLH